MEVRYNFTAIEKKWEKFWQENPVNSDDPEKEAFYCLDMFPYPSGLGLHVGHWRGYTLSDAISRYQILKGKYVLHPMGWDAFGLPAENFAIKTGSHPSKTNEQNIASIKKQIQQMAAVYDWEKEINTTDPEYYKWTQWIFIEMFKRGLAYEKEMPLNWCPKCKVVLANEEAKGGECERCKTPTTKKNLRQWMLKITDYAEPLLAGLDELDWPEKVKKMQSDWIGKSFGAEIDFEVTGQTDKIKVFTTRPDTLYGATFMVLAPEHELVEKFVSMGQLDAVNAYKREAGQKSNIDRMTAKTKTGVFLGVYAVNPLTNAQMPVWVSDYVLADYGTGAIMCVPAHDDRDFEFAEKFDLPIMEVISKDGIKSAKLDRAYTGEGIMVNSGKFDGIKSDNAKEEIPKYLSEMGIGTTTINYKLRDWVFSRQRYWGEPIPLIHCDSCGVVPVEDLPVKLPNVQSYLPTDTGESPLSRIEEFVNTICPKCGKPAKRETNTMPQWAGSSWYFLRYTDTNNNREFASKNALNRFMPVDFYVGGIEHAVLHLLYARFYTHFLHDIGVVDFKEPFKRLFNIGMICNKGHKMDKSGDNGVSPDHVIAKYGCDALRMYEMFIAPPELDADWEENGLDGVYRFINRLYKFFVESVDKFVPATKEHIKLRNKMIFDITIRIENLSMNTVISGFMEYYNKISDMAKSVGVDKEMLETFAILIAPFGPHIAEELWQLLGHNTSVFGEKWPNYDERELVNDMATIVVQINGKLRGNITISVDSSKEDVVEAAKSAVSSKLTGTVVKEIYVPNKLINFVVK